ncbi:hypothetical protein AB0I81_60360 [Nonomuraea sp. NPDC050404]|uniref:hypothetical protein n=1 Tax=Nonomuraea sp. NPDC050404 TaxID=3155783 RepID=UPI0033E58E8C
MADVREREGAENDKSVPPGRLVVQVYDEDAGGPPFVFDGGPGEKVSKIIKEVYGKLELEPKPDDRLTCLATGEDVRQYGDMHLRDYASGRCRDLVWTFVRDTGGASA